LANGNYVVSSDFWNGFRGAVSWGDGTRGVVGAISAANSLVGSNPNDFVGSAGAGVTVLGDSNYLVLSPRLASGAEAVTFVDGSNGHTLDGQGVIPPQNSLLGPPANSAFSALAPVEDRVNHDFIVPFIPDHQFGRSGIVVVGFTSPNQTTYAR